MNYLKNTCVNISNEPLLRMLMQLIPGGSAIDVGVSYYAKRIEDDRRRTFFDELGNGNINLNPELIQSDDFVHCFITTYNAAIKYRIEEKRRNCARLLKSALDENTFVDTDEYEEYLQILDELTYREFLMLVKLDNFENDYPHKLEENDLQRLERFWDQYKRELIAEFKIPEDEIDSMMTRLNRTGCYEIFAGSYMADIVGGKGKVTPTFRRLRKLVSSKHVDCKNGYN